MEIVNLSIKFQHACDDERCKLKGTLVIVEQEMNNGAYELPNVRCFYSDQSLKLIAGQERICEKLQ